MKNIWTIVRREFYSYFASFVAYVILFFLLLLSGWYFSGIVLEVRESGQIINTFIYFLGFISFFLLPFFTMRVFAEENKLGTIELLVTSPITETELVVGKFLGSYLLYLAYLAITLYYFLLLGFMSSLDYGLLLSGYIGLILLTGAYISVGVLISSTTKSQIVAGLVSFVILLFLWILNWVASYLKRPLQDIVGYLSFARHFKDFTRGIIDTKDIIFFISVIVFNLFLTVRILENRKRA